MGIDAKKLDASVACDIAAFLDIDNNESLDELQEKLAHDTVFEAFDKYLTYNGIMNYTQTIMDALDSIRAAEITIVDKIEEEVVDEAMDAVFRNGT